MKIMSFLFVMMSSIAAQANKLRIETVDVVRGAQDLGIEMPISIRSDVNGVCLLLGYTSGIEGTKAAVTVTETRKARQNRWDFGGTISAYTIEVSPKAESLIVDANGTISRQVFSRQLSQVKCINKI